MADESPPSDMYRLGWIDPVEYVYAASSGLDERVVRDISERKAEPKEVLAQRLRALRTFRSIPFPIWAAEAGLGEIDFNDIRYYVRPARKCANDWDEVPIAIRATFDRLAIPHEERTVLGGISAQYDSEVVYQRNRAELSRLGVIFTDMDSAVRRHGDLVAQYLGSVVPFDDNKFAALNAAVWSGGSFLYVPAGVHVQWPLQAYFRINADRLGQFERTLVVLEEGSFVHYIDGCSAAALLSTSLHAGVIEVVVKRGARCRITGLQNWSHSVTNLVTKRAVVDEDATMEWIDGNIGAQLTMNYPSIYLRGRAAHGEVLSVGYAGGNQHQDTGAKIFHEAPATTSMVTSKSICCNGGRVGYRGVVHVAPGAHSSRSFVRCDSLILDCYSRADTYPRIEDEERTAQIGHEATVSKVSDDQLFYLMTRGLDEDEAMVMLIAGFMEPVMRELPLQCAAEINRLIALDMAAAGAVG